MFKISERAAWAVATCVGNESAQSKGQNAWDAEDYAKALAEYKRLLALAEEFNPEA